MNMITKCAAFTMILVQGNSDSILEHSVRIPGKLLHAIVEPFEANAQRAHTFIFEVGKATSKSVEQINALKSTLSKIHVSLSDSYAFIFLNLKLKDEPETPIPLPESGKKLPNMRIVSAQVFGPGTSESELLSMKHAPMSVDVSRIVLSLGYSTAVFVLCQPPYVEILPRASKANELWFKPSEDVGYKVSKINIGKTVLTNQRVIFDPTTTLTLAPIRTKHILQKIFDEIRTTPNETLTPGAEYFSFVNCSTEVDTSERLFDPTYIDLPTRNFFLLGEKKICYFAINIRSDGVKAWTLGANYLIMSKLTFDLETGNMKVDNASCEETNLAGKKRGPEYLHPPPAKKMRYSTLAN